MKKIIVLLIAVSFVFVFGCSSVDSVKVGGGYENEDGSKVDGSIEIVLKKIEEKNPEMKMDTEEIRKLLFTKKVVKK